ncbi:MAG: host specificity factor TipJ family phage tail protein [Methylotenera sp.]|nr:host specificity factor TipJ family phage tail protein [Methylotenera sp.]
MNPSTYTLIHARNPFNPALDRTISTRKRRVRLSSLAPKTNLPFICLVNGDPVLRADWDKRPKYGDIVCFVTLPQGGGSGGSDVLRVVAMIAVIVFAPQFAPAFLTASVGASAAGAIMVMAGTMLVNAILPPPKPPTPHQAAALAAPSPTYSLGAQGNTARIGAAIPVQYGRHIAYPDFAAQPYAEFVGNEQYLYQLLVIGQGKYAIEALRIEDTPISSFEDITYEIIEPAGTVTLFPSNVITSIEVAGQEALTGVALGPFVANSSGTLANYIGIDVVCPRGLFYANDAGGLTSKSVVFTVEARTVDSNGTPVGTWATLATETITAATQTAQRRSFRYAVTAARYQVRLTRTDTKDVTSRVGHDLNWVGLRAYLPGSQQYGNLTLIAMRLRASNSLSAQASRKVNVICTRMLPVWHPTTGWSAPVATRSIAWAFADACRADYGAKLPDARIPLAALYALDAIWATRGDTLNVRFDNTMTLWETLTQIARVGRAKAFQQGGLIQVVRDQTQTLPVAMFSPRNTVKNTLKVDYLMPTEATADAVIVSYFNEVTWKPAEVTAALTGSVAANPAKVQLIGCTSHDQAYREGMYIAACNRYRRKPITLTTEMEGFIPSFGDLVAIVSDRLTRAQAGEVTGWDVATRTLTLSEPITWTVGQAHYFGLRRRDGSFSGPWQAVAGVDEYHAVLNSLPDFTPYTGSNEERTYFSFGIGTAYRQLALVVAARPRGNNQVELSLINDDPLVHTADTVAAPAPLALWKLPRVPTVPAVTGLNVVQGGTPAAPELNLSWQPAAGADHYLIEQSADGVVWSGAGTATTTSARITIQPGAVQIRVAGIGLTRGAWAYWSGSAGAALAPPSNVTGLALAEAFTGPVCNIKWDQTARTSNYTVEVWAATVLRRTRVVSINSFSYSSADAKADGGPWRDLTFKVRGNGTGTTSAAWAELVVNNPQIGALNNMVVTGLLASLLVEYQRPSASDFAGIRVWVSTTDGFTPDASSLKYEGPNSLVNIDLNPGSATYYLKLAGYDQWGTDALTLSAQYVAATTLITTTQITDSSISTPKLTANAVTADKIAANTITAAQVAANSITADKINGTNLAVVNGTFSGALSAATGSFAGALSAASGTFAGSLTAGAVNAVDTINLAGQAVTIPVSASSSAATYCAPNLWTSILSAAITSTGAVISITSSGSAYALVGTPIPIFLRLLRDGVQISSTITMFFAAISDGVTQNAGGGALVISDTPGTGVHTYTIEYLSSQYVYNINAGILLLETKR